MRRVDPLAEHLSNQHPPLLGMHYYLYNMAMLDYFVEYQPEAHTISLWLPFRVRWRAGLWINGFRTLPAE